MRIRLILPHVLTLTIMGISMTVFAANQDVESPVIVIEPNRIYVEDAVIEKAAKSFTLDWSNSSSIAANKDRINEIEALLKKNKDYSKLDDQNQQSLGKLYYRLGAYYTHVLWEPDQAIPRLIKAASLLSNKLEKSLIDANLAYAYAQKYSLAAQAGDKAKAISYVNNVIARNHKAKTAEVAFVYYVSGFIANSDKDYGQAEKRYKIALGIYEGIAGGKGDPYAIVQNDLANNMLQANGHDQDAVKLLENINKYWQTKSNINQNPYAAVNYITLGKGYLKIENPQTALDDLNKAIQIYGKVYGESNVLLKEPYDLLATAYLYMNEQDQAFAYLQKAGDLH